MLDKIFGSGLPEVPEAEPQKLFDREQTAHLTITTSRGTVDVEIKTFSAMYGWRIERSAKDYFSESIEKAMAFSDAVLSHASIGGVALDNEASQNELLERVQNVRAVFEGVLEHNGIDLQAHYVLRDDLAPLGMRIGQGILFHQDAIMRPLIEEMNKNGGTPQ